MSKYLNWKLLSITAVVQAAIVLLLLHFLRPSEPSKQVQTVPLTNAIAVAESLVRTQEDLSECIAELAAAMHSSNTKSNKKWVLTAHNGRTSRSYTDGDYTIISLPLFKGTNDYAIRLYCSYYNGFTERTADSWVEAGEYKKARKLYQLLQHFTPWAGEGIYVPKIALLDKLEKGDNVQANTQKYLAFALETPVKMILSGIENIPPMMVTNLLDVAQVKP
jgi:hypothetical protein